MKHNLIKDAELDGDPGAFCLGRPGLYLREVNSWIIFLVFKGTDLHSGFSPTEKAVDHEEWVKTKLSAAWDHSGPENRCGYVNYFTIAATRRNASMLGTPAQVFGNFGAAQPYKHGYRDFATHGRAIFGGNRAFSNFMGREAVLACWNTLQFAGLDLKIDLDDLLKKIMFKNDDGQDESLLPLEVHPIHDHNQIQKSLGHYAWYQQECQRLHILLRKADYINRGKEGEVMQRMAIHDELFFLGERQEVSIHLGGENYQQEHHIGLQGNLQVTSVVDRKLIGGKVSLAFKMSH
jgi:hypothetical protein